MKRPLSLQAYLVALALTVIVPFAGLVAYLVVSGVQHDVHLARDHALRLARESAAQVSDLAARAEAALTRLAGSPQMRDANPQRHPPALEKFLEDHREFACLYMVNPSGQVVHRAPPQATDSVVSFGDESLFVEMRRTGEFQLGRPSLDPLTGQPVVFMACPIHVESSREVMGGLCGGFRLLGLDRADTKVSPFSSGLVTVLDQHGSVLVRSVEPERWIGKTIRDTPIAKAALAKAEGYARVRGEDGTERLYGFATIANTDWRILIGIPLSAAFAPTRANAVRSAFLAAGAFGLALALAAWLGRRIARPIQALAGAASQMVQGQWDLQLPAHGPRDIDTLAREFNTMAQARKRAEDTLLAAEAKFRTLAERSLTGVYIIQGERFLYANPRMAEIFGYTVDECKHLAPLDLVAAEDRRLVAENLRRRMAGEVQGIHYAWRGLRKDGEVIEVEVYGNRTDWQGQPAVIGTLLDITKRKQAEQALREAKDYAESLIHTASVMIVGLDSAGNVNVFNEAAEGVTGYRRADLVGKNWFEVLVPRDRYPHVWAEFERLMAGGLPQAFENPILTKPGEERLISWRNNEVRRQGKIVGTISFGIDLTERKRAEQALQESEEKYRTLVEQAFVGIFIADSTGRILEVNPCVCQLFGAPRQDLVGRLTNDFVIPEEQAAVAEDIRRLQTTASVYRERHCRRKDGTVFPVEVIGKRLPDGRILGILQDITDRRRTEVTLRRVNRMLTILSEVNQELVRAKDERETLHNVCRIIVTKGDYRLAWIGYADHDERKSVRPVAQFGFEEGYLEQVGISWADDEHGRGPTGTTIRTARPAVAQHILTDASYAPWRAEATKRGYASSIALPLLVEEKAFGALNIYSPEPAAFDEEETNLLLELANDLSFGIRSIRAEIALRESMGQYRTLIEQATDGIFLLNAEGRFLDANPTGCNISGFSREEFLGMRIQDTIAAAELPRLPEAMAELKAGKTIQGEWRCLHKNGSFFPGEIRSRVLPDGRILTILRDATERKRAEAERARLAAIIENTSDFVAISSAGRNPIYLNRAARAALGIGDQGDLSRATMTDYHPGWVNELFSREAYPQATQNGIWTGESAWLAKDGEVIPTLQVILAHKSPEGRVEFFSTTARDITPLKLAEKAVRAVSGHLLNLQEEERRRIARELHDTTAQNLTALTMNLAALRAAVPPENAPGLKALDECFRLANQSVQEIRTFSYLLHPPVLDELGLARALHDYAAGFQQRSKIKIELDLSPGVGPLTRETEMALFRVVQESLGNIHRHSGSATATIRLWRDRAEVWLEVQDAGKGIPGAQWRAIETGESPFGVGIAGMRERMKQLGGRLDIRSGPQGTTVQAIVPADRREDHPSIPR